MVSKSSSLARPTLFSTSLRSLVCVAAFPPLLRQRALFRPYKTSSSVRNNNNNTTYETPVRFWTSHLYISNWIDKFDISTLWRVSYFFIGMWIMTNMLMHTWNVVPDDLLHSTMCEASKLSQRLLRCCCRRRTYIEAFFTLLHFDGNMTSMSGD